MKRLLLLLLLLPTIAWGQATTGYHRLGQALSKSQSGVVAQVVPFATVTVSDTATGLAGVIYSDPLLTVQISPPVVRTDGSGNYDYYLPLNSCVTENISSPGRGSQVVPNVCSIVPVNPGGPFCPLTGPCNIFGTVTAPLFIGPLTGHSSLDLPLTGGTMTGLLTVPVVNNVQYVGASLSRGGIDVGDELNLAYSALPAIGGKIFLYPKADGTCYSFTTPIVFAAFGKYVQLEGLGIGGGGTVAFGGGSVCLNYTPHTGTAVTLDYATNTSFATAPNHGWKNIYLINDGCVTSGGCGYSAWGIDNGSTNAGMCGATMEEVSIAGFGVGYRNVSHNTGGESQGAEVMWINPLLFKNTTGWVVESPTGMDIYKGWFSGNGQAIVGNDANANVELKLFGTTFSNTVNTPVIDFTANTSVAHLYSFGSHFENGHTTSQDMLYVSGDVSFSSNGDFFENDSTVPGGCTTVVSLTGLGVLTANGVTASTPGGNPCPVFVTANTDTNSGFVSGFVRGFTAITGGTYGSQINYCTYDYGTVTPRTCTYNSGLSIGKTNTLTPLTLNGTPSLNMQMILGNSGGVNNSIGTVYSSSGLYLGYNAQKYVYNSATTFGQVSAGAPSGLLTVDNINGLSYYSAASSSACTSGAPCTLASMFGTPLFTVGGTSSSAGLITSSYPYVGPSYRIGSNVVLGPNLTGFHGSAGTKVQYSDNTGTLNHYAIWASDGSLTNGAAAPSATPTGCPAGTSNYPCLVATIPSTTINSITASVALSTFFTTTVAGLYRACVYQDVTVAGTVTGSGTVSKIVSYTSDGHAFTVGLGTLLASQTQWNSTIGLSGTNTPSCLPFYADTGVAIQHGWTVVGTITAAPTIRYSVELEYLGP